MKALEEKIKAEGRVLKGNILDVGGFLNQLIDPAFTIEMAEEVKRLFAKSGVTKILTMESSGIAIGFAVAAVFNVPLVFAKKRKALNQDGKMLTASVHSYTHNSDYTATVSADYINENDTVLIVDDFLANGEAMRGLIKIIRSADADLAGCVVQIEKGFQHGGDKLRAEGIRVEALALIDSMSYEEGLKFRN
ncbi:MAG: xanthine phosphoribosyltransferase [Clostridiales bacterium]|nr:xanthine phosphoribosyltransferase [Clostridiales bacterium]